MHDATLLMNLYKLLAEKKLDRFKFFQMLVRALVQELGGSRASVWFYTGDLRDQAQCESLFDATDNQWTNGERFSEDDFGPHFEALRSERKVVAVQARSHAATACFNEGYLDPLNVYSVLDAAIEVDGTVEGFVRCEMTVAERDWSNDDLFYLQKVAAMVALALKKQTLA